MVLGTIKNSTQGDTFSEYEQEHDRDQFSKNFLQSIHKIKRQIKPLFSSPHISDIPKYIHFS